MKNLATNRGPVKLNLADDPEELEKIQNSPYFGRLHEFAQKELVEKSAFYKQMKRDMESKSPKNSPLGSPGQLLNSPLLSLRGGLPSSKGSAFSELTLTNAAKFGT